MSYDAEYFITHNTWQKWANQNTITNQEAVNTTAHIEVNQNS
jgi:hypothetical protein